MSLINRRSAWLIVPAMVIFASLLAGSSPTLAQVRTAFVGRVRALEGDEIGVTRPAGLAFLPGANAFQVVAGRGHSQPVPSITDLVGLTPLGDPVGSVRIAAAVKDPINMAFDSSANRLLLFHTPTQQLITVLEGTDGNLDPGALARHDARHFGLRDPQGMAVDPASGHVFILDASGPRLVRIEPEPDGTFDAAVVSSVDLRPTGLGQVRGLAFDPGTGHLFLFSPPEQNLYELTQSGQMVALRDLSEFHLRDLQGMVFAPSGDLTDAPEETSLYIADSGLEDSVQNQTGAMQSLAQAPGEIIEMTFTQPMAPAATIVQGTLIQTIDTSQWSPPSPDPAGIVYLPSSGTLLISDSEVEEMPIFAGANLFEMGLTGDLITTASTLAFSVEPTGITLNPDNGHLFMSDDVARKVFEVNPGPDGRYATADDIISSFSTTSFGSTDPEDVTFDWVSDVLYIADGLNREIYRVDPGANGIFDGPSPAGDDQVTHFDMLSLGMTSAEGLVFDPDSGHLYVVGEPEDSLLQVSTTGILVRTIDISAASAHGPAGLAYAPGSQDPLAMHVYIVDRGVDNNFNPFENDGQVYEFAFPPITPGNLPPMVDAGADQVIIWPATAVLDGTVSDDGLPSGVLTTTWSLVSGPGSVTLADASAAKTTVSFAMGGPYVFRLSAGDSELTTFRDVTIAVAGEVRLDVRVMDGADDAEEAAVAGPIDPAGHIDRTSPRLELVSDGDRGNQIVGMRFDGLDIPPGQDILEAHVQFQAAATDSGATHLTLNGEAADNARRFTSDLFDISSRPTTSATVAWSPAAWDVVDEASLDQRTPNIASIVQQIVDRPGWSSGNSLAIFIRGTGVRRAWSWNGKVEAAPLLHVVYDTTDTYLAPKLALPDQIFGPDFPQTPRTIDLWDYAWDPDTPLDQLTFALSSLPPSDAGLTLSGSHYLYLDPNSDWCGYGDATVHATDTDGRWSEDTFRVAVTWSCPEPTHVPDQTAQIGQPIVLDLTEYEPSVGDGSGMYWRVTGEDYCLVSGEYSEDDVLTFTPHPRFVGSDKMTLHMLYPWGIEASQALTLTWIPTNTAPVLSALPDVSLDENATLDTPIDLWAYAADGETPDDELTYRIANMPAVEAGVSLEANRYITITPAIHWCGVTQVQVEITDPEGWTGSAGFQVEVNCVNDAPWIDPPVPNQTAPVGQPIVLTLATYGHDWEDEPTTLSWSVTGQMYCSVSISAQDHTLIFTPQADFVGSDTLTLHLHDSQGGEATQSLTLIWRDPNLVHDVYLPLVGIGLSSPAESSLHSHNQKLHRVVEFLMAANSVA